MVEVELLVRVAPALGWVADVVGRPAVAARESVWEADAEGRRTGVQPEAAGEPPVAVVVAVAVAAAVLLPTASGWAGRSAGAVPVAAAAAAAAAAVVSVESRRAAVWRTGRLAGMSWAKMAVVVVVAAAAWSEVVGP